MSLILPPAFLLFVSIVIGGILYIIITPGHKAWPKYVNGELQLNIIGTIGSMILSTILGYAALNAQIEAIKSMYMFDAIFGPASIYIIAVLVGYGMPAIIENTTNRKLYAENQKSTETESKEDKEIYVE